MKLIPTKIHAILDYVMGVLLMVLPWLLDFARGGPETWTLVLAGAAVILYSIFTNYEYGLVRRIPMNIHLVLDLCAGAFLIISPWLFGFADYIMWPHVVLGVLEVGAALMTQRTPLLTPPGTAATTAP